MPISAIECFSGRDLSEPRLSPGGERIAYVRTDEEGSRIVIRSVSGEPSEILSPWPVRSGRSLGGGCFDWMPDGSSLVAVSATGEVRMWDPSGNERRLVRRDDGRIMSSPVPNVDGTRVAFVVDQAEIHEVDLASGKTRRVDEGDHEFVLDPTWWRGRLVWQAWSAPDMPWDESVLVGEDGPLRVISRVQHQQPRTTWDGETLGWIDDETGWLNVRVEGVCRVDESFEHAGPTWGERQRSWCFDSSGRRIAFVRNEKGFGRLCTMDLATGRVEEKAKAVHGQLSWRGDSLSAVRTGGRTPTQVVVYDTSDTDWNRIVVEVGPTFDWSSSDVLVEPELIRVSAGDGEVDLHARFYRSPSPRGRLICWIHGGPTDQWQVVFMPRIAFWLARGYDVLVPDFRGSTGHGRAYTQALRGRWGVLDVADVHTIARDVVTARGYGGDSVAVFGSSAGGLTALCVAALHPDLVSAVIAAYPVCDMAALDAATHRFEAHYNRSLIGDADVTQTLSEQRSPIGLVEPLSRVSVLVFHGSADPLVPIEQSIGLVSELRRRNADAELVVFDGEGHGFRNLDNRITEFGRAEEFLEKRLRSANERDI